MSEMVERVARAMALKIGYGESWGDVTDLSIADGEDIVTLGELARAAIAAMREPSEAMVIKMEDACDLIRIGGDSDRLILSHEEITSSAVTDGWRAMIDEALR